VVRALAMAGRDEQAETLARTIPDPDRQARALTEAVRVLANATGKSARIEITNSANRLAAIVCSLGRWTTAVRTALLLDADAFTALSQMQSV
jgi:hypothetical protein